MTKTITKRQRLLDWMRAHPDVNDPAEIRQRLGWTAGATYEILDALRQHGFITRIAGWKITPKEGDYTDRRGGIRGPRSSIRFGRNEKANAPRKWTPTLTDLDRAWKTPTDNALRIDTDND